MPPRHMIAVRATLTACNRDSTVSRDSRQADNKKPAEAGYCESYPKWGFLLPAVRCDTAGYNWRTVQDSNLISFG